MVDGVSILVAESAPAPAALLLRAMLESLLAIEYFTQDRAQTRSRALATSIRLRSSASVSTYLKTLPHRRVKRFASW